MPAASLIRESGCCLSICTFSLLSPAFPQSFLAFSIMDSADKSKYHFYSFCVIFTVYSLFIHIFYLLFNTLNLLHFLLRHLYQSKQKKRLYSLCFSTIPIFSNKSQSHNAVLCLIPLFRCKAEFYTVLTLFAF